MIDDIANGVGPARARISADGVDAGPLGRTVVVLAALNLDDRRGGAAGAAAAAHVSAGTHADHSADRMRR